MKKLTAHQVWKKAQKEDLTDKEYKQLLLDNNIIVKRKFTDKKIKL